MNRTELIEAVAAATGLERKQAEAAVMAFVDSVVAEAKSGNKVSIYGFGTFTPTARAARTGRNPQTGAPVKIPAKKGVRFAPASAFKATLNTKGAGKRAAAKKTAVKKTAAKKTAATKASSAAKATKTTGRKATAAAKATSTRTASTRSTTARAAKTSGRAAGPAKTAGRSTKKR